MTERIDLSQTNIEKIFFMNQTKTDHRSLDCQRIEHWQKRLATEQQQLRAESPDYWGNYGIVINTHYTQAQVRALHHRAQIILALSAGTQA